MKLYIFVGPMEYISLIELFKDGVSQRVLSTKVLVYSTVLSHPNIEIGDRLRVNNLELKVRDMWVKNGELFGVSHTEEQLDDVGLTFEATIEGQEVQQIERHNG